MVGMWQVLSCVCKFRLACNTLLQFGLVLFHTNDA